MERGNRLKLKPKVTVIVINWNGREFLSTCLKSLNNQTWKDFEILLVDNGSTDGSPEFVAENFPRIKVIKLKQNQGFCKASNIGIALANGEYIVLLNNDTEVAPHWLEELVKALDEHPEVGFCASKIVLQGAPHLVDSVGDAYSIAGSARKIGHLDFALKEKYRRPKFVFGACAGAAIYRRSMLEDIGLFDEDLFIAQEDVDLSFRAQLKGYKCLYVPTALVYHRLSATLKTYSTEYVYYGHRNLEFVYLKNMPLPLLLLTFPLHVLDVFLSFCFFCAIGKGGAFLRAKRDALKALPHVLKKRREIQRGRTVSPIYIFSLLDKSWPWYKLKRLWKTGGGKAS